MSLLVFLFVSYRYCVERGLIISSQYYDSENISESQLAFRSPVGEPEYHEQGDGLCMELLYNIERLVRCQGPSRDVCFVLRRPDFVSFVSSDDALVQERGSISTEPGLALASPNLYQHQVSPFELEDNSRPGHRKILAFFLVDPNEKVPSASDIGPQQAEWMSAFMHQLGPDGVGGTYLERLPTELKDHIVSLNDGLISEKRANEVRDALIAERSVFVDTFNKQNVEAPFNMCEH